MRARRRKIGKVVAAAVGAAALVYGSQVASVGLYDAEWDGGRADCAIVLGAAVWNGRPSPVYRERVQFAIELAQRGAVDRLVFTGGYGRGDSWSEASVGARVAQRAGIAADRILLEESSRNKRENLTNARPLLRANGLRRCYLVSDPLHLRRATALAAELDLDVRPAATPTTRIRSLGPRAEMLFSEAWYLLRDRLTRPFR